MKIKSVEISAFRIYDDPKDAIFNFTDKNGSPANFVSLYAPNGFGKTSFYDAVEWGITKSIDRFYIRSKELERLADQQAEQNKIPLIRNSKSGRDTYVKITTNTEKQFDEKFWKHGNQIHDISFKNRIVHDFQQVILSQEWISAFLTESDGEIRYKKFMEKPDLAPMNNYYNNLKLQLGVLKDKKTTISNEVNTLKDKVISSSQKDLLRNINSQIRLLISDFQQKDLFQIQLSTTREEIKNLRDIIANNVVSNNTQLILNEFLDNISVAKSGNDSYVGINMFFEYKSTLKDTSESILRIDSLLNDFEGLEKSLNELNDLKKNLTSLVDQREKCEETLQLFEEYKKIYGLIVNKKNEASKLQEQISPVTKQLELNTRQQTESQSVLESFIQQLDSITDRISQLPSLRKSLEEESKEIAASEASLQTDRERQFVTEKEISSLENLIKEIELARWNTGNRQYSISSVGINQELIDLINQLEEKKLIYSNEREKLNELNIKIEQQQELNSSIQNFIKSGLAIVNNTQTSTCPLCEYTYKSYIELVEKINNNAALSLLLQQLFSEKSALSDRIALIDSEILNGNIKLIGFYDLSNREAVDKKAAMEKRVEDLKKIIEQKEVELQSHRSVLTKYNIQLEGLNITDYEKMLLKKKVELNDAKMQCSEKSKNIQDEIVKINEKLRILRGQIDLILKEIEQLNTTDQFIVVKEWFKKNAPSEEIAKGIIIIRGDQLLIQLKNLDEKEKQLKDFISQKTEALNLYSKDSLKIQQKEAQQRRIDAQQKTDAYNNYLKERLQIDAGNLNKEDLLKNIEEKERQCKNEIEKNRRLLQEYDKLAKYSENIEGFLQSENAKHELEKLKSEEDFLTEKIEPVLNKEKEKTKLYLQERIKAFFYEKLINDLYKKIDPHPDFKEVHFRADFDLDSPRLDVYVKNNVDESMLIPNLYFSTAQINILSLSIFLATALNSKDYDCIFIDDPIQSMDSINVLSTIDLLRSIVVSHNKQIILSTHDENFHNLLKKKMPPELFKSKFLELESFGKVKTN